MLVSFITFLSLTFSFILLYKLPLWQKFRESSPKINFSCQNFKIFHDSIFRVLFYFKDALEWSDLNRKMVVESEIVGWIRKCQLNQKMDVTQNWRFQWRRLHRCRTPMTPLDMGCDNDSCSIPCKGSIEKGVPGVIFFSGRF